MLTHKDLDQIKAVVKTETKHLPSKKEFYSKMDEVIKELKDIREEQEIITGRNSEYRETLENHDTRISALEQTIKTS